jgi:hypothetical protein
MACHTQEEIAAAEDVASGTIGEMAKSFLEIGKLAKNEKAAADHAVDFDPPIYNIWKQQTKSDGSSHFGNSEVRWVENALSNNSRITRRRKMWRSVSWWLGDWWAFGEARYGERKAIVDAKGWEGPVYQTCADAAMVCRKFETSRRREDLTFNHHREVAALPPIDHPAARLPEGRLVLIWTGS